MEARRGGAGVRVGGGGGGRGRGDSTGRRGAVPLAGLGDTNCLPPAIAELRDNRAMTGSLRALRWTRGALRRLDTILTRATAPIIDTGATAPSGDALAEAEDFFRSLASNSTSRPSEEAHWHRLIRTIALSPRATGSKRAL